MPCRFTSGQKGVKCTLRPHPLCECPRVTALQVAKIPRLGNNDSAKKFEKLLLLNPITIGHERNVGDLFVLFYEQALFPHCSIDRTWFQNGACCWKDPVANGAW